MKLTKIQGYDGFYWVVMIASIIAFCNLPTLVSINILLTGTFFFIYNIACDVKKMKKGK